MEYIFVDFKGVQYWIEADNEGYALRQIMIEGIDVLVSCRDDCLAEGLVDTVNDYQQISENDFEDIWNKTTHELRQVWDIKKQKYKIGQRVYGLIKYFYPQGAIFELDNIQGCADVKNIESEQLYPKRKISGIVKGYDEQNMWVLIHNCTIANSQQ